MSQLSTRLREIFRDIDQNSSRYVEDLRELIRHPSVAAQNYGIDECSQFLKQKMEEVGIAAKILPTKGGPPVVYGEVKSSENNRTILFYAHYDVQPPEPLDEWTSPPFAAELREGKIIGRGASDDKSGVMAPVKAVESYLRIAKSLPTNVKFLFEGEEEIGSPHLEEFVKDNKDLLKADGMVGYDGDEEVGLGARGVLYVELSLEEKRADYHAREAPVLVNPAWRLVWALNSLKDQSERVTIDGFYDDVKNPTEEDIALIRNLRFEPHEYYSGRILENLRSETKEKVILRRLFSPTINIDGITSGYAGTGMKSVLPKAASAKVDFRLVPNQDPEEVFQKLKRHLANHDFEDIAVRKIAEYWPFKTSLADKMVQVIIKSSEAVYARRPPITPLEAGAGPDMRGFTNYLNLSYVGTGAATTEKCNHAPNEYVAPEDYIAGTKKAAAIIHYFGQ